MWTLSMTLRKDDIVIVITLAPHPPCWWSRGTFLTGRKSKRVRSQVRELHHGHNIGRSPGSERCFSMGQDDSPKQFEVTRCVTRGPFI